MCQPAPESLGECVNPRLKAAFPGHEVKTVAEMGWQGCTNGVLLAEAEQQFDVLITLDKNLEHQQNLRKRKVGIVVAVVPDNRMSSYQPILGRLQEAAANVKLGQILYIGNP